MFVMFCLALLKVLSDEAPTPKTQLKPERLQCSLSNAPVALSYPCFYALKSPTY